MRRVVITGLGCFLPCGDNIENTWEGILNKECWIKENNKFNTENCKSKIASFFEINDEIVEKYSNVVSSKDKRRLDDFIYIALLASYNAMKDSGLLGAKNEETGKFIGDYDSERFGTFITSGIGGIKTMQETIIAMKEKGAKRAISPFFLPSTLTNMVAGNVAMRFNLTGAVMTHVSACASSTHAIGEAFEYIKSGKLDKCLAGGSESAVCEIGIGGFDAMNALSTRNDDPQHSSRALDKDRDGFVMGEGSVVLVLEELESAKKRGAKIYCEVVGYGATCDAYHITSPDKEGRGAKKAMELAIEEAGLKPENIDYINLHGTSTPVGDMCEINAIKKTFGDYANKVAISSTKSATGHLLGATGALEAMFCAKTLETQTIPPSINIENLDENCAGMNIIQDAKKQEINTTLSNSFGFGGTNGTLVFKRYVD